MPTVNPSGTGVITTANKPAAPAPAPTPTPADKDVINSKTDQDDLVPQPKSTGEMPKGNGNLWKEQRAIVLEHVRAARDAAQDPSVRFTGTTDAGHQQKIVRQLSGLVGLLQK